jgi:asparagine synthase (glutamine-hydrolysing)
MCGVAAAVGPRARDHVESMVRSMAHRGIRSRIESGHGWAVGHVRLPIVGVGETHDQPVGRGRWVVAFVGEVLDFRERSPGAECDVDLVADTWVESRFDGFREFDGFWSVIAAHPARRTVYGLVDYLSQKPIYVRDDPHATAVASEPDAVAALGPVSPDRIYLSSVVKWGYCPETWRTPYAEVRRMTSGQMVTMTPDGVQYETVDPLVPIPGTPDNLRAEIEAAVRRRVTSADVPVAALVSGGLDSSIVWTLASRYGDLRPYHVENGEWDRCRLVCPGATRVDLSEVTVGRALSYHQEPVDLGSLVPQAALSDAVGRAGGERVCLTGDGADELFGGYGRSVRYDSQASDVWHELVAWHLPRLDRVMMRNRIEVRSPFLARRVAGMALALPRELRTGKKVLRDLFRGDLPDGIVDAPKIPLRTGQVEADRVGRSADLVRMFMNRYGE